MSSSSNISCRIKRPYIYIFRPKYQWMLALKFLPSCVNANYAVLIILVHKTMTRLPGMGPSGVQLSTWFRPQNIPLYYAILDPTAQNLAPATWPPRHFRFAFGAAPDHPRPPPAPPTPAPPTPTPAEAPLQV